MAKKTNKKRVIATGGAGFIDAHLTREPCKIFEIICFSSDIRLG